MFFAARTYSSVRAKQNFLFLFLVPAILLGSIANTSILAAEKLPQPTGPIILTITGNIERTNAPGSAEFDRTMLERLGVTRIRTSTSWTDGKPEFAGVLARDVLKAVGARGKTIKATALNDYSLDISVSEFDDYRVLFAMDMDGIELTARDKGPIWIVYPRDNHSELQSANADTKWIWQLTRLEVK